MAKIKKLDDFNVCKCEICGCDDKNCECNKNTSESLNWHLNNNINISENIFRIGSESFFDLIKEGRSVFNTNPNLLNDNDFNLYKNTDLGTYGSFEGKEVPLDLPMSEEDIELNEALYKDKEVELNKPMRSKGPKKFKVYVKDPETGKIMKVNFGDKIGGLKVKISDPKARKAFSARHKCHLKNDKTTPGYWSCRVNRYGYLFNGKTYPGFW